MDENEAAALRELGERSEWPVDELPRGVNVDMLRRLDDLGYVEARWTLLDYRQARPSDPTPVRTPQPWVSPIRSPHMMGDWDRVTAGVERGEREHPNDVRLTERGRAALARLKDADARRSDADASPLTPTSVDLATAAGISPDTLSRIRTKAGIRVVGTGGAAAKHRYPPADVAKMVNAAERGNFRERAKLRKKWSKWLPESARPS